MPTPVSIEGVEYISSRRASELSGYTQDYIGQLARAAAIQAKRIGGLWHVSLASLNAYTAHAENYTPKPPEPAANGYDADSIVSFDGKDYISASRAAKLTGYHQDYVGQLARSGKIGSRQVGNRWFVDRTSLEAHKDTKDALLAAVQTEAVGLQVPSLVEPATAADTFFSYRSEKEPVLPAIHNEKSTYVEESIPEDFEKEEENLAPINFAAKPVYNEQQARAGYYQVYEVEPAQNGRKSRYGLFIASGSILIVLGGGFFLLKSIPSIQSGDFSEVKRQFASTGVVGGALSKIAERIEQTLGHEEIYKKK